MAESVQKVLDIQDLMLTPEAKKLQSLDQDMHQILQDKGLGLEEKIKKFELKLGEFRHVQEKIIEQGTTSLADRFRNDSWKEEMKDILQLMLDETIQRHLQNQSTLSSYASNVTADGNQVNNSTASVGAYSTPAANHKRNDEDNDSNGDTTNDHQSGLLSESPPSQIISSIYSTSTNATPEPAPAVSNKYQQELAGLLEGMLKSGGMKKQGGRYYFPIVDSATRNRLRKQHYHYAESTFQRLLSVLISPSERDIPGNASGLVDCVKHILMPGRANFRNYYDRFPNLENLLNNSKQFIDVSKWATFDSSTPMRTTPIMRKKSE